MTLNFDVDLSIFNIKKALLTHSQRVSLKKRFSHKDRRKKIQHDQIIHNLKAPINLL